MCEIIGGYMLAKTLVVFYVWSPDIFVLFFTIPYHTIYCKITMNIDFTENKTVTFNYKLYIYSSSALCIDIKLICAVTLIIKK